MATRKFEGENGQYKGAVGGIRCNSGTVEQGAEKSIRCEGAGTHRGFDLNGGLPYRHSLFVQFVSFACHCTSARRRERKVLEEASNLL